jgi:HPt (histidine-containing phosphotransfer) domain-containing protein
MSNVPLLDHEVIDALSEAIGTDGTRTVFELFMVENRAYLDAIAAAAADMTDRRKRDEARRAAHTLKSGAGQIGAAALSAAAAAVERAAGDNGTELLGAAAALLRCAAATDAALKALLPTLP